MDRISWQDFQNYIDFDMNSLNTISGEPLLKQTVYLSMIINKGEIPYSRSGSNLFQICQKYYYSIYLAAILIKFDIIETIMSKNERQKEGKVTPYVPCLERIDMLSVNNITAKGFSCKIKLDINGSESRIYDYECYWNNNEEV